MEKEYNLIINNLRVCAFCSKEEYNCISLKIIEQNHDHDPVGCGKEEKASNDLYRKCGSYYKKIRFLCKNCKGVYE